MHHEIVSSVVTIPSTPHRDDNIHENCSRITTTPSVETGTPSAQRHGLRSTTISMANTTSLYVFFYKSSGKTSSSFRLRFASHSESTVTLSHKDP